MNDGIFASFRRHAATVVSRRRSLRLLGGAGLAGALAAPTVARAGKAGKKARKVCQRQRGKCEAGVRAFCSEVSPCLEYVLPCCHLLARCQTTAAIECLATFGGIVVEGRAGAAR